MIRRLVISIAGIALAAIVGLAPAIAQDGKLKKEELDQLLAPIALYPDELLTNVLMAATYPLDVVQAARWKKEPANAKLKGDALAKALEAKDWDPSIKALVQFPDVLQQMSEKLDWTQKLGDAFLAQQDDVMDQIQFLRAKAADAGKLKSNDKQKVVKKRGGSSDQEAIFIEPAEPGVVYAPIYDPTVVYGDWWYPDYPPYYWPAPTAYYDGYYWGAGIAIAGGIWGWNHFDWWRHNIDIDVNKWNKINVNRAHIASNTWQHRPDHRGPVPYRNKDVRDKFKQADRRPAGDKELRGRDKGDVDRSRVEDRLKNTDHSQIKDKVGDGAGDRARDKAGDRQGAKGKDRAANVAKSRDLPKSGNRQPGNRQASKIDRPSPKRSPGALDIRRGADVRQFADRGRASRMAMPRAGLGGPRGFSGGRSFGGRRR